MSDILNAVWEKTTEYLKDKLSPSGYQTFISSCTPSSYNDTLLSVEISSEFSKFIKGWRLNRSTPSHEKFWFMTLNLSKEIVLTGCLIQQESKHNVYAYVT